MKRCILGSQIFVNKEVTNKVFEVLDKKMIDMKVLFIPNEKATSEKIKSGKYLEWLKGWGFEEKNIYVFDKEKPDESRNLNIDIIVISGGNTFGIMHSLIISNFKEDIKKYVNDGVIYIGESAGSHIASKNFKHVEKYDDNASGITDYDGLNFFDGIFICHFDEGRNDDFENLKMENTYQVYSLSNNEFIDLKDDEITKYSVE